MSGCAGSRQTQPQPISEAEALIPSKIDLAWDYVPNVWQPDEELIGYHIYRRPAEHGEFQIVTATPILPQQSTQLNDGQIVQQFHFEDLQVIAGHLYEYEREKLLANGNSERESFGAPMLAQPVADYIQRSDPMMVVFNAHNPWSM